MPAASVACAGDGGGGADPGRRTPRSPKGFTLAFPAAGVGLSMNWTGTEMWAAQWGQVIGIPTSLLGARSTLLHFGQEKLIGVSVIAVFSLAPEWWLPA